MKASDGETSPAKVEAALPEYSANHPGHDHGEKNVSAADAVRNIKSPGVARIEAVAASITFFDRCFIFAGVFLVAYVYGLDGTLRYTYQPKATDSFGEHSLLATINVVRSVIAVAAQPTAARIADIFGRFELVCVAVLFYTVGTVIETASYDVATFAGGSIVYQIGYTGMLLLVEVIIADITTTRARLFFSYIPALPFIINTWVSGNISDGVLARTTWHWGVGMFAIIFPVCSIPLLVSLFIVSRRAKKQGRLAGYRSPFKTLGAKKFLLELFWLLDVIGIVLVIAVFGLILAPLTVAGGFHSKWKEAKIIAPLVVGLLCIPAFVLWELRAPHPLVPFSLLKDRAVWAAFGIALCLNFAYAMQSDYLYTLLIVAFDFSTKKATRITSLYSFSSVIVGTILGLVVYKVRRLKVFVVAGTCLYLVAFGMLIHYRGGTSGDSKVGIVASQVVLGIAGGLFPYTTQAALQVAVKHEHLAVITAIFLATYNIGSALGFTVSGAMWTQILPGKLEDSLANINSTLAPLAYASPFENVVAVYPVGTRERTAVISAYQSIQRLLTIVGICICVPLCVFALCLRNPKLNDEQTLAKEIESDEDDEDNSYPTERAK